jgi:hypothetical protein
MKIHPKEEKRNKRKMDEKTKKAQKIVEDGMAKCVKKYFLDIYRQNSRTQQKQKKFE